MTEIGSGELIDKITILEIKSDRIADVDKLKNVKHELSVLSATRDAHLGGIDGLSDLATQLKAINEALWEIEDEIIIKEKNSEFDDDFIKLARNVYIKNDIRFEIKNDINNHFSSELREQKDYEKY